MSYNFGNIKPIPNATDMVNIVLSKTQRKTPTVVHPGYAISRIRGFYMRKIKFCEDTISERLTSILDTFPKIEDIHPFYGDLFNVLYDKDHYKLALGHVKATKNMIENMAKDYLKLIKYGDSLYRCKSLKRAALGRMCTMIRKINSSLAYLEEVRKHLGRLPSINPYEKTILLTGYPNVGKSSFINTLTKANVQVQPYPFTTQALYIGHSEYKNQRYQVIDSPGILDHNLDQMNTIEMQSVTALAHLKSCVIYFVDPSLQCGYSIQQQIHLFERIKPLLKNKPMVIAFNKSDLMTVKGMELEKQQLVQQWIDKYNLTFVEMSTLTKEGVDKCKQIACQKILAIKQESLNSTAQSGSTARKIMKMQDNYIEGMYVSQPKRRDSLERPSVKVDLSIKKSHSRPNIAKLEEQNGGAGVFNIPLQQHYIIPENWKYDAIPQIYNGKNIGDFVDKDIWERLQDIQKQEDLLLEMQGMKIEDEQMQQDIDPQMKEAYNQIQRKKHAFREQHLMKKSRTAHSKNKSMADFKEVLDKKGLDSSLVQERMRNRSRSKSLAQIKGVTRKRRGSDQMVDEEQEQGERVRERQRSLSRSRSKGYHRQMKQDEIHGKKVVNKLSKKWRTEDKKGQSDRFIGSKKPKHLFSGKSSNGKKDWR